MSLEERRAKSKQRSKEIIKKYRIKNESKIKTRKLNNITKNNNLSQEEIKEKNKKYAQEIINKYRIKK